MMTSAEKFLMDGVAAMSKKYHKKQQIILADDLAVNMKSFGICFVRRITHLWRRCEGSFLSK
jgi:predicted DNA repair protein MutK